MAPFMGPDKKQVMNRLRRFKKGSLEITLGRYQPQFVIRLSTDRFELLPLELDNAKADEAAALHQAEGYYQPEMDWVHLAPGNPIIKTTTLKSFIAEIDSWEGWTAVR
jgi:hypothetical protein